VTEEDEMRAWLYVVWSLCLWAARISSSGGAADFKDVTSIVRSKVKSGEHRYIVTLPDHSRENKSTGSFASSTGCRSTG
jgi:hypothetical protein